MEHCKFVFHFFNIFKENKKKKNDKRNKTYIPGGKHLGSLEEEQVIIGVFTGGLIELDGTVLGELQS